ncbi:MAG: class I SAM-dependent methyltransferase [Spirochaetaceae bacterium]
MRSLVLNYVNMPKLLKKPMWRVWHNWIISRDRGEVALRFMNYGYAPADGDSAVIDLAAHDEPERYGAQLYHFTASYTDLAQKDVLEVGCGRGGGASYIARYLRPRSYVGLDLSENGIRFCNTHYTTPNLRFVRGDAEALPFEDDQFDAVVNVESSRAYNDVERFFAEAYRVLRPGGAFLLTDMRLHDHLETLDRQVRSAGFRVEARRNITRNVVRALDIDDERRKHLMRRKIPRPVLKMFSEFAGVRGSGRYAEFATGKMQYVSYFLHKPAAA